jgi:hypothetical protein
VYFVGLQVYCKMINGTYNIKLRYFLSKELVPATKLLIGLDTCLFWVRTRQKYANLLKAAEKHEVKYRWHFNKILADFRLFRETSRCTNNIYLVLYNKSIVQNYLPRCDWMNVVSDNGKSPVGIFLQSTISFDWQYTSYSYRWDKRHI